MYRIVVILSVTSRVIYTMPAQHHTYSHYFSKRSHSDLLPTKTRYTYSQLGDTGIYAMFDKPPLPPLEYSSYAFGEPTALKTADKLRNDQSIYPDLSSLPEIITDKIPPITFAPVYRTNYELSRMRADAKYASLTKFVPSDDKVGKQFRRMMLDAPPSKVMMDDMFSGYDSSSDFHNDDDDIRSSGKSMYDNYWPYFYHSPYEYDHMRDVADVEKAKEKRYALPMAPEVIPVHEDTEEEPIVGTLVPPYRSDRAATDDPVSGNGPFFSYVLNDYYDKNHDEDHLSFKGLGDWGKDFDHESYRPSSDDISRRDGGSLNDGYSTIVLTTGRPERFNLYHNSEVIDSPRNDYTTKRRFAISHDRPLENNVHSVGESAAENGYKKVNTFDKKEKGENTNSNHKSDYNNGEMKYNGFKNFLDTFANKFGTEDLKKDSQFLHQVNSDKGEKKKGFRRVYHKDEFQEDNEFYDNNNNRVKAEEKGSSNAHIGGSEAFLHSQAAAAIHNAVNAANEAGNDEKNKFANAHKGHNAVSGQDHKFHQYIDVAKQAARSNSADYLDHYRQ